MGRNDDRVVAIPKAPYFLNHIDLSMHPQICIEWRTQERRVLLCRNNLFIPMFKGNFARSREKSPSQGI